MTYIIAYLTGVDSVKLRDDEYTLQHVKAFGITNHLVLDQWNPENVVYVDNTGSVMMMRVVRVSVCVMKYPIDHVRESSQLASCS